MEKKIPLLSEFLRYVVKPTSGIKTNPSNKKILFNVIRLWSLVFVISIFYAILTNILLTTSGYSEDDFMLIEVIQEFPYLLTFLLVALWAPLSEEIAFRLWLRFSRFNWALGLSLLSFFYISFSEPQFIPEGAFSLDSWYGAFSSIVYILFVFVFIYLFLSLKNVSVVIEKIFKKYFSYFFFTSALLFAFLHITNYNVDLVSIWYYAPLLIFPQIFLSFMISFIRMRYGFSWAVITHSLNNAIAITPALFLIPILENGDFSIAEFSVFDMATVFLVLIFLIVVFCFCFLSIISLFLEFTKRD